MEFGIPKVRQEKKEKYENEGVLTFLPTGEKLGRKVILNKKAIEMLNINGSNNQISFSFNGKEIYIVNTSDNENVAGLKIGKVSNGFADKKHYEHIKSKIFGLQPEDELELFMYETENKFNGNPVFGLSSKFIDFENLEIKEVEDVSEVINTQEEVLTANEITNQEISNLQE